MRLGVIGGLGPVATAHFLERIATMTDAGRDQEHLELIVMDIPTIPDRTAYILGKAAENPVAPMITLGRQLKSMGANVVAIPCVTAHCFHEKLQTQIGLPVIHGVRSMLPMLEGVRKVGLLATDGTLQSGIFQQVLEPKGIELIVPAPTNQQSLMNLIYRQIKAGLLPDERQFCKIRNQLWSDGADVIILGCTELSLLKKGCHPDEKILDVLEVLARESILSCGKKVKPEFKCLLREGDRGANQCAGISGGNGSACAGKAGLR